MRGFAGDGKTPFFCALAREPIAACKTSAERFNLIRPPRPAASSLPRPRQSRLNRFHRRLQNHWHHLSWIVYNNRINAFLCLITRI